ncbi:MAG: acetate--CoA ligase family protein, partial [Desulfobacteraceae bacterium]
MKFTPFSEPSEPTALNEHQSKQLLRQYDIPIVDEHVVHNADQAVQAALELGFPVVLKGLSASAH